MAQSGPVLRWLLAICLMLFGALALAQETPVAGPDYPAWQTLATRAEAAIDAGRASDRALEAVRAEIVQFRQQFLSARSVNDTRIRTLQSQIAALGEVPENGEEPPEIAARRAALSTQLLEARAPVLVAEEAFSQADGLVREIDRVLAERRATQLLSQGQSPLNPALWPAAVSDVTKTLRDTALEWPRAWANPQQRRVLRGNLPLVVVLLLISSVLLVRGRHWAERLGNALRGFGLRGLGVWSLVVSLGRIALPVLGLYLLSEALFASGMVGLRSTLLVEKIPLWGGIILLLRWICERLFSRRDEDALIPFGAERRKELRLYGTLLAGLVVLRGALNLFVQLENATPATGAVLGFPLLAVSALLLFRIGQILITAPRLTEDLPEGQNPPISSGLARMVRLLGRAAIVVALLAPVCAGFGYTELANFAVYPSVLSLGLLGFVCVLQSFFADIYVLVSRRGEAARDALIPVMTGFVLVLLALPVLALIWGVRTSELAELWTVFNEGFRVGETRISPTDFLLFALIFAVGYALTRLFQSMLKGSLLPKTRLDAGGQNAIVSGTGYIGIFLAAILAITGAGIDLSALALVAGALSVGIGFGLQNIVSNFVSGIILLIERPIAQGDWIEVNGSMGYVRDISVRATRIETFDRTDVIVPNADFISGTVTNYTRGNTVGRVIVPVGVAYGTDTRMVERILREVAEAHPMVLATPAPSIVFQGFGADALDFEIRAILRDVNWVLSVKSDMNHEIAKRFVEAGIEIPFAQRDIWLRNPEALAGAPQGDET